MIECVLRHIAGRWVAENNAWHVDGVTLEELDRNVRAEVLARRPPGRYEVFMFFDNATIPQWIRQFSQHYFNRIILVEAPRERKAEKAR